MTDSEPGSKLEPHDLRGLPRRCSIVGGALLVLSGLFPWFSAGAITTDPLRGQALLVAVVGVIVVVAGATSDRAPSIWLIVSTTAALMGLALVAWAAMAPPDELTASLGVGLCLIGSMLVGLGAFAAHWRRRRLPVDRATDRAGEGDAVDTADDLGGDEDGDSPTVPRRRRVLPAAGLVVAAGLAYLVAWPAPTSSLRSEPSPATSYDEAIARFEEVTAREADLNVYEPCESQLLTHGERTDVAVVLYHGLTNCPKQFVDLGTQLFDAGANVVILRAPDHGIANDEGTGIGGVANVNDLTSESLRDYADESVDIARGLGDEVRALGLSMGGVVAAWTAQERGDVDRVVTIAPAMTIPGVPASLTRVFRNIFHKLPNVSLPSAGTTLDHAYAGQTTKGLDATFEMGAYVADEGYGSSPASPDVIVVLNPDDDQVDPVHLSEFASAWAARGGPVALYRLPAIGLPHDVIDVDQPEGDPDLVYPILVDLLDGNRP